MKQIVPIPIPFFETVVTVLFAISPPDLKVPDIISIRQDIPRVILTSTVYIQLLDGFRDHRIWTCTEQGSKAYTKIDSLKPPTCLLNTKSPLAFWEPHDGSVSLQDFSNVFSGGMLLTATFRLLCSPSHTFSTHHVLTLSTPSVHYLSPCSQQQPLAKDGLEPSHLLYSVRPYYFKGFIYCRLPSGAVPI